MIKKYFMRGLVVLLPIALTLGVLKWLYNLMASVVVIFGLTPNILIVILALFILFIVTAIAGKILGNWFNHVIEIIKKIPIVKNIYVFFKDLVSTITTDNRFDTVVWVRYAGVKVLGFLTNPEKGYVFIMTAPNPTSGMVIQVEEWEEADMTVEEAVKWNISLGITSGKRDK